MFGFFKRKKKQDPAPQDQAPDQAITPDATEDAADEASSTSAATAERPVETRASEPPVAEAPASAHDERPAADDATDEPVAEAAEATINAHQNGATDGPVAEQAPETVIEPEVDERPVASAPAVEADAEVERAQQPAPEPTPALKDEPRDESAADAEPMPAPAKTSADVAPEPEPAPRAAARDDKRAAQPQKAAEPEKGKKKGWFARIKEGLGKTRANLSEGVADLFLGKKQIDDELMEDLETQLLMADVGIEATTEIIDRLTARVSRKELKEPQALYEALQEELAALLEPVAKDLVLPEKGQGPFVILMVGVNGVGKTTTIGKLAKRFQGQGRSVMLAAGDTFRAAAVEQLKVWGERNEVPVIAQHTGADSASVIYDALSAAKARGVDVLIADTAGRLHNKSHLMEELKKVQRVMGKLDAAAPHEVMLVLDAGTGQNALSQAATFNEAVPVTGITLTKLDGTAKGGIIFALAKQLGTPIRYIGVGETVDDLRPFAGRDFVDALFDQGRGE
ncbi:signal recognition particle-docking protein FtsY [Halomonas sp. YLGW01]|uniref:signal recognition particle-docking protein FtsY n=1 Tax=Halomonas sp. YLGW01 TaxID=2773308 RepID=UPI00177CF9BC|nr:signal recognition particle-docking protein FtsY [Halomonas sp. YLGW01]